jgi:general secretion pathway protein D
MNRGNWAVVLLAACLLGACGQAPIKPSPNHMRADEPPAAGAIPPPVQVTPLLPKPRPALRPETYSVVVNNVRVQELLFALARDARLQIDIDPALSGTVTLNAIDQTLPQLLSRIARQVDMRYEMDGDTLIVMRDSPFLRAYKVDYLSAMRSVKMQSTASTQFGQTATGPSATGAVSTIDVGTQNNLWESIVQNVKDILRETDRIIPAPLALPAAPGAPAAAPPAPGAQPPIPAQPAPMPPSATYQEAAAVIGNRETGILYVRATAKQHERVQEFLDQVMAGAKRQVLIEATVAEVQLRNEYQRGISWERLRPNGQSGVSVSQGTFSTFSPTLTTGPFTLGFFSAGSNVSVTLKLLEQFGDVRVLSSPKLSVLNNQTAILRVTRDIIYFTIVAATGTVTASGSGTVVTQPTFNTTPTIAAEGFMMAVLPQISASDAIVLNVRPTIRRQVADAIDPNPALRQLNIENRVPVFETREFDSILRLQSGQTGVLAGLMQDIMNNVDTFIPGLSSVPILGDALSNRSDLSQKTELVIFLRATVLTDPSIEGDLRALRDQLPKDDFFSKPNPVRIAPPVGPETRPAR